MLTLIKSGKHKGIKRTRMASKLFFQRVLLLVLFSLACIDEVAAEATIFDVTDYGAIADGLTDSKKAFSDAWSQACGSGGDSVVMVPPGTFLLSSIEFQGPCNGGSTEFQVQGVIQAPTDESSLDPDYWVRFRNIDKLTVSGGGSFDGQGASAWSRNDCTKNPDCKPLPTSIGFYSINNSWIHHIKSINSKSVHIKVYGCTDVKFQNIAITAPEDSPNTDGIKISESTNIDIFNSEIGTGDDCIAIITGSKFINITDTHCGPGHGISIGSLGKTFNKENVIGVNVRNCNITGTQAGLRIKTWSPSHVGLVSHVLYEDINLKNVSDPILIDQQYCPSGHCSGNKNGSRIAIKDVKYKNVWGTSSTETAVTLTCSGVKPCEEIELRDIDIAYSGAGGVAKSSCSNVRGAAYGKQLPPPCI